MERLKAHFANQGLEPADLPKAIVIHEVLGASLALFFWFACYTLQPSRTFMRPVTQQLMRKPALQRTYSAALAHAANVTRRAPFFGRDPTRAVTSLAESVTLRGAIKPLTFPFKIWASWRLVLAMRSQRALTATT